MTNSDEGKCLHEIKRNGTFHDDVGDRQAEKVLMYAVYSCGSSCFCLFTNILSVVFRSLCRSTKGNEQTHTLIHSSTSAIQKQVIYVSD